MEGLDSRKFRSATIKDQGLEIHLIFLRDGYVQLNGSKNWAKISIALRGFVMFIPQYIDRVCAFRA